MSHRVSFGRKSWLFNFDNIAFEPPGVDNDFDMPDARLTAEELDHLTERHYPVLQQAA